MDKQLVLLWMVYLQLTCIISASSGFRECLSNRPNCMSSFDLRQKFSCPSRGRFTHDRNSTLYFRCLSPNHVACECACPAGRRFDDLARACRKIHTHSLHSPHKPAESGLKSVHLDRSGVPSRHVTAAREIYKPESVARARAIQDAPDTLTAAKLEKPRLKEDALFEKGQAPQGKMDLKASHPRSKMHTTKLPPTTSRPTSSVPSVGESSKKSETNHGGNKQPRRRHKHGQKRHHDEKVELKPKYNDLDKAPEGDIVLDGQSGFRYIVHGFQQHHTSVAKQSNDSASSLNPIPTLQPSPSSSPAPSPSHKTATTRRAPTTHHPPKLNKSILDRDVYIQRWIPNQLDIPRAERLVGVPNLGLQLYEDNSPVPAWAVALMALCLVILLVIIVLVMY